MNQSSQGDNSPNIDNVGRDVNHLSQEGEFVGIENNEIQGAGYVEKVKGSIHNARDTIVNETHIHQYYSQPLESKPIAACPNNLPLSGVRNFIGRDRELKKLHSTLKQSQSMAIAVVSGMGGIGKTELAWQYASNYGEEVKKITWGDRLWNFLRRLAGLVGWKWRKVSKAFYRGGICWVSVRDSDVDVGLGIVNFARVHLGLHPPEDLPLRDRVGYCWQHWPIPGEVLVIFDDLAEVQQIESFLPNHHRFKVIITTRTTLRGGIFNPLVLEGLKTDKTLDLLSSLAGSARIEADRDTARSICRMLGDLPLAIELVGQYIKEEPDVTLTELRGELAHNALNQEALKKNENIKITAKRGVKAALELSWKVLSKEAQELAMQLSIFALAPIPWEWVQQCYADTASVTLRSWRGKLIGQSLLKFEGDGYELHPLVREFFAEKRETWEENEEQIEQFCRVAAAKIKSLSDLPTQSQVQSFEKIFPHMEIAAEQYQDAFADDDLIPSFAGIARYCKVQRLYDEAESWFERCLLVARNHFGEKHRHVTTCLHNLADFYNNRGRYKEAEILFLQVLEWREKNLGEEHPDVILSRNGLAILYYNQGRYKEAEILFLQV
ncbi:MAG: tetratricopeptide repeat protein, partial [Cyanobacteria bacterium P01_E01_bin.42]